LRGGLPPVERSQFGHAGQHHHGSEAPHAHDVIEPLLREPRYFYSLAGPLFDLTGDMALLRRSRPPSLAATEGLRELAVTNGFFTDYRELRKEATLQKTRELLQQIESLPPSQVVTSLPPHPTTDDQPMIVAALRALLADWEHSTATRKVV
jgi:hypothetical protein